MAIKKENKPSPQAGRQGQGQDPTIDLFEHIGELLFFYQKQEDFVLWWKLPKT